ncbi:hypothetical protein FRC18_011749 [Serendipita sp. 400]|nr:hypothetical protein FRC18_011749 [Serendipita sp. 400]
MSDSRSILPGEIWYQILLCAIDAPWVLDTTVPAEGCFWHQQDKYHNEATYNLAEIYRRNIRLVCRAWRDFADEHRFRWITWDPKPIEDTSRRTRDAEEALGVHAPPCLSPGGWAVAASRSMRRTAARPLRILISVKNNRDLGILRDAVYFSFGKLTTLFINCRANYGTPIFDLLIQNSPLLPCVRCLMLKHLDFTGTPLAYISTAFPKLTGMTLEGGTFPHNPEDYLILPQAESLYFDFETMDGMTCSNWRVPSLLRLSVPILWNDNGQEDAEVFTCLRLHGSNLRFLHVNYAENVKLPPSIWKWCPKVTEIVTSFSVVSLPPIPSDHPVQYFVHIINHDAPSHELMASGWTSHKEAPKLLGNVERMPKGALLVVGVQTWGACWGGEMHLLRRATIQAFWSLINETCVTKDIRLENESKQTYQEYLQEKTQSLNLSMGGLSLEARSSA